MDSHATEAATRRGVQTQLPQQPVWHVYPGDPEGYDDLIRDARMGKVGRQDLPLASLGDIIRSKKAAARPKDMQALPVLYEALERQANLLRPPEPPDLSGLALGPKR